MKIFFPFLLTGSCAFGQNLSFDPGLINESTVNTNYYNTEYIYIKNESSIPRSLSFELIYSDIPEAWSVTGCTNMICYTKVPDDGSLGTITPAESAYISINLSANDTPGDGIIQFAVFDELNPSDQDTVSFIYHVESDSLPIENQPWAQLTFAENVLTVFLKLGYSNTILSVYDSSGNLVINSAIEDIYSVSLRDFPAGMYIVKIKDEDERELTEKIVKI
ncbi:MAG: T9SS type A sorting domain-containing protein [Crocinitomicaceae bacterium]|nr:T9SS type A sorting domain-containing protein [Crocinitomicaceae bacterium]MBK8925970.1 T9SS type A sorting domain-containing protein [Crocinitomicaceae bacterium]